MHSRVLPKPPGTDAVTAPGRGFVVVAVVAPAEEPEVGRPRAIAPILRLGPNDNSTPNGTLEGSQAAGTYPRSMWRLLDTSPSSLRS